MQFKVWLQTEIDEHLPSILKGIKEFLRIGLIAVLPVLVYQLENNSVDYKMLIVLGVIAILKAVDRTLHERGVETGNESLTKGLTRF